MFDTTCNNFAVAVMSGSAVVTVRLQDVSLRKGQFGMIGL